MISYQVSTPLRKYPFNLREKSHAKNVTNANDSHHNAYLLTGELSQPSALYTTPY